MKTARVYRCVALPAHLSRYSRNLLEQRRAVNGKIVFFCYFSISYVDTPPHSHYIMGRVGADKFVLFALTALSPPWSGLREGGAQRRVTGAILAGDPLVSPAALIFRCPACQHAFAIGDVGRAREDHRRADPCV